MNKAEALQQTFMGKKIACTKEEVVSFDGKQFIVTAQGEQFSANQAGEYIQFSPEEGWEFAKPESIIKVNDICVFKRTGALVVVVKENGWDDNYSDYIYEVIHNGFETTGVINGHQLKKLSDIQKFKLSAE